jgi:carboxymethylenebutenolidase
MQRKSASEFDPRILEIFDGYVHGKYSKREVLSRFSAFAVGGVTATGILESLQPNYAFAQQVKPDDPAIKTETITYDSPKGTGKIKGLLARPSNASGKLPAVLVVHENRGLNPYIEDVVRRVAKAGYIALGPDGLTPVGGYPGNDVKGLELQAYLDSN